MNPSHSFSPESTACSVSRETAHSKSSSNGQCFHLTAHLPIDCHRNMGPGQCFVKWMDLQTRGPALCPAIRNDLHAEHQCDRPRKGFV